MDALLLALESAGLVAALRSARWGYAAVSAMHILGIGLLLGAIMALDLRFLGLRRHLPIGPLVRLLVPLAASGLAIAVIAGGLLFSIRAGEYAGLGVFQIKLALIFIGTSAAVLLHWRYGLYLDHAPPRRLAAHGALSMICWLGALICGRAIAFVTG